MSRLQQFALALIITFAAFFRLTNLETLPQAFFTDEAALGYNAWSLLTTGRDEYGELLPLTLRSFDDYKPAIYSYLSMPFIWAFGLTQAASRAVAALFSVVTVLALFWLVRKVSQQTNLALLAALVLAATPWHIEIGRTAIEAGVAVALTLCSLAIYSKNQPKREVLSFLLLLLALWTYHSARLVAPVIWLGAIYLGVLQVSQKFKIGVHLLFFVGLALAITLSQSRFGQISVFNDLGARLQREEAIREDGGPIEVGLLETRIFHNKPASVMREFADSYITNTSLSYLFLGGAQPPRVTIPETGQFLLFFLPFFLLGLARAFYHWRQPLSKWLVFWLLIAPLPAALTTAEIPHTYRTVYLLPVIATLIAMGLLLFFEWAWQHLGKFALVILLGLALMFVWDFGRAWHQYRVHQQVHQPWYRQYGYRELFEYLASLDEQAQITITNRENEPYMMYLFYNQIEPAVYQQLEQKRLGHREIEDGASTWQLFNLTFAESACPHDVTDTNPEHYYVVTAQCELQKGFKRVRTVNFLDGNPEFHVDRPLILEEVP